MQEKKFLILGSISALIIAIVIPFIMMLVEKPKKSFIENAFDYSSSNSFSFFDSSKSSKNSEFEEKNENEVPQRMEAEPYKLISIENELKDLGLDKIVDKYNSKDKVIDLENNNGEKIGEKTVSAKGDVKIVLFKGNKIESTEITKEINGKLNGPSVITYSNGAKEEFTYVNGIKEGKGVFIYENGDIEDVIYKNGVLEGEATYKFSNGDREETVYKNGVLNGPAKYIYADGTIDNYEYVNGERK